jgi:hypothetical protein
VQRLRDASATKSFSVGVEAAAGRGNSMSVERRMPVASACASAARTLQRGDELHAVGDRNRRPGGSIVVNAQAAPGNPPRRCAAPEEAAAMSPSLRPVLMLSLPATARLTLREAAWSRCPARPRHSSFNALPASPPGVARHRPRPRPRPSVSGGGRAINDGLNAAHLACRQSFTDWRRPSKYGQRAMTANSIGRTSLP